MQGRGKQKKSVNKQPELVGSYILGEGDAGRFLGPFQKSELPGVHITHLV